MKKYLAAALCVSLCILPAHAEAVGGPEVAAASAVLMEKETGKVLFEMNPHQRLEPASVTKIMTLLLTMEALDSGVLSVDDTVQVSARAASMGGSQVYLKEGEVMSVHDLLKAVAVASGNDASVALAEHLAGSESAFVEKMNAKAVELGMSAPDLGLRHCPDEPGADLEAPPYPGVYDHLDGYPSGWSVPACQYQQAGAVL